LNSFGGLRGVIKTRAEVAFAKLPTPVQACLGTVFRQLVQVDEHSVATRARARLNDIMSRRLTLGVRLPTDGTPAHGCRRISPRQ
jgi:hypothetical protein